jgi:DNA primase
MARGEIVYNVRAAWLGEAPLFIVEGAFDALALWPDGLALLGKPSPPQIELLVECSRPVVVVLDGDAWEEGWALAQRIRFRGKRAGSIRLPPCTDPDEVPRQWLDEEAERCLRT